MSLLDQLEMAGLVSAAHNADGTITVTIQAGLIDPRPALEAAKADGRSTRLGVVQKEVLRALYELGDDGSPVAIQDLYDTAMTTLPVALSGRDMRAQNIKRALGKLHEFGYLHIYENTVRLGSNYKA